MQTPQGEINLCCASCLLLYMGLILRSRIFSHRLVPISLKSSCPFFYYLEGHSVFRSFLPWIKSGAEGGGQNFAGISGYLELILSLQCSNLPITINLTLYTTVVGTNIDKSTITGTIVAARGVCTHLFTVRYLFITFIDICNKKMIPKNVRH